MKAIRRGAKAALLALVAMACVVTPPHVAAQQGPPDAEAMRRAMEERNLVPNTPGDGPYPAVIEADAGLPGHVIYRPADLAPFGGGKLPVFVWGNGGCADDGTAHRFHLAQIASYGYLVIAAGHWRSGPGAVDGPAPRRMPTDGSLPPPATTAADVIAGLDWALAENSRADSKFYGKVDSDAVAVGGHSCGGLQAIELAADPRIDTVLIHNSGIYNGDGRVIPGMSVSKDMLANFHTPVIYILGGPTDVAYPNGTDDYQRVSHVPIVLADLPVGHGGTFGEPMGGAVAHVAVDWLEWQLRGDDVAARTFLGENCRLCIGTDWTIERKGL
jgi:hypothetical protein